MPADFLQALTPGRRPAGLWAWLLCVMAAVLLMAAAPSAAQTLPLTGLGADAEGPEHDPRAFQQSLEEVIETLEDAEQRGALLESLRDLQRVHAESTGEVGIAPARGCWERWRRPSATWGSRPRPGSRPSMTGSGSSNRAGRISAT